MMTIQKFREWAKDNNIELLDEMEGFKTGEIVNVINGYGHIIENLQIKGFKSKTDPDFRSNAVVYVYDDSYWFPIELDRLRKIK
ncbi:hypothetical protein CMT22_17875 [Elizabethkingia anophelis]|nr:hypothetical protein [Elizabethkingia anophelis]